eukprot:jgi/Tetstr1/462481/TSEL_007472.t2
MRGKAEELREEGDARLSKLLSAKPNRRYTHALHHRAWALLKHCMQRKAGYWLRNCLPSEVGAFAEAVDATVLAAVERVLGVSFDPSTYGTDTNPVVADFLAELLHDPDPMAAELGSVLGRGNFNATSSARRYDHFLNDAHGSDSYAAEMREAWGRLEAATAGHLGDADARVIEREVEAASGLQKELTAFLDHANNSRLRNEIPCLAPVVGSQIILPSTEYNPVTVDLYGDALMNLPAPEDAQWRVQHDAIADAFRDHCVHDLGIDVRREVDDLFKQAVPLVNTVPRDELKDLVPDAELSLPALNVVTGSYDPRSLKSTLLEVKTMRYMVKYTDVPRATAVDRFERSLLGDIHRGLTARDAAWRNTEPGRNGPLRGILDMSEYTGMVFGTVGEYALGQGGGGRSLDRRMPCMRQVVQTPILLGAEEAEQYWRAVVDKQKAVEKELRSPLAKEAKQREEDAILRRKKDKAISRLRAKVRQLYNCPEHADDASGDEVSSKSDSGGEEAAAYRSVRERPSGLVYKLREARNYARIRKHIGRKVDMLDNWLTEIVGDDGSWKEMYTKTVVDSDSDSDSQAADDCDDAGTAKKQRQPPPPQEWEQIEKEEDLVGQPARIVYDDESVVGVKGKEGLLVNSVENNLPCAFFLRDDCYEDVIKSLPILPQQIDTLLAEGLMVDGKKHGVERFIERMVELAHKVLDYTYDCPAADRQELELDPHTFRDLDIGADVQLCKLYYINDLVSGAEWVVDGYVEADASVDAVWQEKRVKDSKTGSIISLQELEELLMARVLAQFEAHKVRDLDTGEVVDLFAGVSRASVMDSIQKDLRVHDKDSGLMLSLLDLRDVLVPSVHVPSAKKGKHRRLKLKGKHVRRMAAKVATGLQAGMAGMQWKDSNNTQGYHSQPPGSTADGDGMVPGQGVKVQVHKKQMKELSELRILQKVEAHDGLIWAMKFSPDGLYLASGGQDKTVSVWEVVPGAKSSRTDRHSSARVAVRPRAYRRFPGHEADILDIAWSPSGFVLSSSMDRTVRLWHISVDRECLRIFKHTDFVTCVQFHPSDDKVFMSGAIDGKVRLWNIPQTRVMGFADCQEMITAASFSPGGDKVAAGTMAGRCRFYSVQNMGLVYEAQLDVCTAKGRSKKICGIEYMPSDKTKVLITSNDSRLRLYNTTEYQQCCKYKGLVNRNAQIRASFSPDGRHVVCGSDHGQVFVWRTVNPLAPATASPSYSSLRKNKNSAYEVFQGHADITTVAMFAPGSLRVQPA